MAQSQSHGQVLYDVPVSNNGARVRLLIRLKGLQVRSMGRGRRVVRG